VAKGNISIYIGNVIFSKIVAFKWAIKKFLNIVPAHIVGLSYPFLCLFYTLFSCHCPFKSFLDVYTFSSV
jgi:hypothetical protein